MECPSLSHVHDPCFSPPDEKLVYGPVEVPGAGRWLGLNVTPPGCRVCSFTCAYCDVDLGERSGRGVRWPSPGEIESALGNALPAVDRVDAITISGRGEPTLHPRFGGVVAVALAQARRGRPGVSVRIVTNGNGAARADVRRALDLLDERIVKLDANPAEVNQPGAAFLPGAVIAGLALLRDLSIESCFVEGRVTNADEEAVSDWIGILGELRPRRVTVYSVPPPEGSGLRRVEPGRLAAIAERVRQETGADAAVR